MTTTQAKGKWAEQTALEFLQQQGLSLLQQNYRTAGGEIDLIMQAANTTIFVEVRYRAAGNYVSAVESIDRKKCERIIRTSQHYLLSCRRPVTDNHRFDVITVCGNPQQPQIGWIKDAFDA